MKRIHYTTTAQDLQMLALAAVGVNEAPKATDIRTHQIMTFSDWHGGNRGVDAEEMRRVLARATPAEREEVAIWSARVALSL